VRVRQRADLAIKGADVVVDAVGAGQAHDRLNDRNDIARAMVDFFGQQDLTLFSAFSFGDIGGDTASPYETATFIKVRRCRAGAPTHFAIRPQNAGVRRARFAGCSACGVRNSLSRGQM
jgi:hypothetical protein